MVGAIAHQWRQPLAILDMIVQDFYAAAEEGGAPSWMEWDEFKAEQGGSGLGLYLAKMLVETGFGGALSHANLPEGTCFIIELPVTAEEQQ